MENIKDEPKTCIVIGNPLDGLQIIGPFDDDDDARCYAEQKLSGEWWITEMLEPEPAKEQHDG
ncbi:hypothetical protein [Paraburkholderia dinghuensis]|uniref:Uncharacterized protein n=1 Tax=Paraburkholderia dinghuensis TaxID=2305225 RepID=A0A3N6MFD0_9BURK|nr:hypothetical protein [Paraburkholderia dinghuensis]RQH02734.1 hypothetical protein D1Y85_21615 [Paraburkholderia dinghuensis]